ncbi:MAG: winged helix-turn-helix transcriptional regulator [Solirubrobacterales bacterium]
MAAKSEDIKKLIKERLAELDQERNQLLEALAALEGAGSPGRPPAQPGSPVGSDSVDDPPAPRRPGRRRREGGTRSEHAEQAVAANPGITASDIAEQLKIKPNYVYRVMADLVKEGRVSKKGTGYFPPVTE